MSVSSRRYQVAHQASLRYERLASSAICSRPKLQAWAKIAALGRLLGGVSIAIGHTVRARVGESLEEKQRKAAPDRQLPQCLGRGDPSVDIARGGGGGRTHPLERGARLHAARSPALVGNALATGYLRRADWVLVPTRLRPAASTPARPRLRCDGLHLAAQEGDCLVSG